MNGRRDADEKYWAMSEEEYALTAFSKAKDG
jgi:hypothetical protein